MDATTPPDSQAEETAAPAAGADAPGAPAAGAPEAVPDPALAEAQARGEALAGKLAGYPGPAHRRAYLDGLLRSGMGFLRSGNGRSAAYCLDKVSAALEAEASAASAGADSGSADSAAPEAGRAAPLDGLRARWREERVRDAASVLERHGRRLTALERKAYRDGLAKWNRTLAGSGEAAARRADLALSDLRRRLYGRILKSQKAVLVRRSGPGFVPVQAQFAGPIGPYNDRQNLEGVLGLLAQGDPAWVEEFLELYQGLADLKALLPSGSAAKP